MTQWFTESFRAEFEKQAEQIGRINLAVFGKTGVGKSTLVNAIFGEPVAVTGIGSAATLRSHPLRPPGFEPRSAPRARDPQPPPPPTAAP